MRKSKVKKYKGEKKAGKLRICSLCKKEAYTRRVFIRSQEDRKFRVEDRCFECNPMGATPRVKIITRLADDTDLDELNKTLEGIEEMLGRFSEALMPNGGN